MATRQYLAMTAAEIAENPPVSPDICWMACRFSSCGDGLENLPGILPEGALLSVNDSVPMGTHNISRIAGQLTDVINRLNCSGLYLDFQRPAAPQYAELAESLTQALPCPVILPEWYAKDLPHPVCLSPVPPSVPLRDCLSPWKGRDVWLELGLDAEVLLLTQNGCTVNPLPRFAPPECGHPDEILHCHYTITEAEDGIRFTLWRTREDLLALIREAEEWGIAGTVGLYQELWDFL